MKMQDIEVGTIIRHVRNGSSWIVAANYTDRITAVDTIDIQNPPEWEVLTTDGKFEPMEPNL